MKVNIELEYLRQKDLLALCRASAKAYNRNASMIDGKIKVRLER